MEEIEFAMAVNSYGVQHLFTKRYLFRWLRGDIYYKDKISEEELNKCKFDDLIEEFRNKNKGNGTIQKMIGIPYDNN
jgi:hypothetical protein